MSPKWVIFFGWLFLVGVLTAGVAEQQYLSASDAGIFQGLFESYQEIQFTNPIIAIGTMVMTGWEAIVLVFRILMWDYACFEGAWIIFRVFGIAISVGFITSLVLTVTRGVPSGA